MKAEGLDHWGSNKIHQLEQCSEVLVLLLPLQFSLLGKEMEAAGGGLHVCVHVEGGKCGLWPLP